MLNHVRFCRRTPWQHGQVDLPDWTARWLPLHNARGEAIWDLPPVAITACGSRPPSGFG
jgi:hypothetical protein